MAKYENEYGSCGYCICDDCAMIYGLYVNEENRRMGHGRELLQEVIKKIREFRYEGYIKIRVEPTENSISVEKLTEFYESMGLKIISSHEGA
jgi:GNAT superfamily N-acetyltransferase